MLKKIAKENIKKLKNLPETFDTFDIREILNWFPNRDDKKDIIIEYLQHSKVMKFLKLNDKLYWRSVGLEKIIERKTNWMLINDNFWIDLIEQKKIPHSLLLWIKKDLKNHYRDEYERREKEIIKLKAKVGDFLITSLREIVAYKQKEMPETIDDILFINGVDWDKEAEHENFNLVFDNWANGDAEMKRALLTFIGHLLMERNNLGGVFFLIGFGANGKSKFIELLAKLLRDRINVAGNPELLGDDSFETKPMTSGYSAVAYHELKKDIRHEAITWLKQATDPYNRLTMKVKNADNVRVAVAQNHIFASNFKAQINENTDAVLRRFHWIPFNANFNSTDNEKKIDENELNLIINDSDFQQQTIFQSVNAYFNNNCKIYYTDEMKKIKQRLTMTKTEQWLSDWIEGYTSWSNEKEQFSDQLLYKTDELYTIYSDWMKKNGYRPYGTNNFLHELEQAKTLKLRKVKTIIENSQVRRWKKVE